MKILKKNLREGYISLLINNEEDLWYLSQILNQGDQVRGKCTRKIKVGGNQDKSVKKTFTSTIEIEEVEYEVKSLRLNGKITEEIEEASLGSHQSINVEVGDSLKIAKDWTKLDLDKVEEAEKEHFDFLLAVVDRDEATIAMLKKKGYDILASLKGESKGKQYEGEVKDFFKDVGEKIKQYFERYKSKKVIIGCSTFWNEGINKNLGEIGKKALFVAFANSGKKKDIENLLQQKELASILESDRTALEISLVEEALVRVSKNEKIGYGLHEVAELAKVGAVDKLLISEKLMREAQSKGEFENIDKLMKDVENTSGEIFVIKSNHDSGKRLFSLGGVIGVLRY
jgi:protein pelota